MADFEFEDFKPRGFVLESDTTRRGRDTRDGSVYVYDDSLTMAVRVALATGRPLLLLGSPGSGKSSLAAFVARSMDWNYFEQVVTSRTQAKDLMWSFDAVRRLRDAHGGGKGVDLLEAYIEPRVLWWAFDLRDARDRGAKHLPSGSLPRGVKEHRPRGEIRGDDAMSVVLLDEIDKADPDVPNDLLVALGSQRFWVDELEHVVEAKRPPLVLITSNNERSLPQAFLRRCVIYVLEEPSKARLVQIAEAHFPDSKTTASGTFDKVAEIVDQMKKNVVPIDRETPPSTAEYLDAVRACIELHVQPGDNPLWKAIESAVLIKRASRSSDET
jgi:MoxR-like ATPase